MDETERIRNFRDLRVWHAAMDLVEQVYEVTRGFPKYEMYGLASQMQRAGVSVASNIAEGHARRHRKEFLHHLSIAHASLAELETQMEVAGRLKYVTRTRLSQFIEQVASLAKQLHALRNALLRTPTPNP